MKSKTRACNVIDLAVVKITSRFEREYVEKRFNDEKFIWEACVRTVVLLSASARERVHGGSRYTPKIIPSGTI